MEVRLSGLTFQTRQAGKPDLLSCRRDIEDGPGQG